MRGVRGVAVTAAAVAALFACLASAASAAVPRQLTITGALTFTWTGAPSRGCAADGLCGVSGELVLAPRGGSQSFSPQGLRGLQPDVAGVVRVRRVFAGSVSDCLEPADDFLQTLTIGLSSHRTALIYATWSSGRCAGPLASEVPSFRLPVRRLAGRYPRFNLAGTYSFGAGPFIVTAISTLRVISSPPAEPFVVSSFSSGSSGGFARPLPVRHVRVEYVQLRYRVVALPGDLGASFQGVTDPVCQMLDSCGAAGTLTLATRGSQGRVTLTASRVTKRAVSGRRALRDFLRSRLEFIFPGVLGLSGSDAASLTWGNGARCSDSVPLSRLALTLAPTSGPYTSGPLPLSLQAFGGPGLNVFRTHCPGPTDGDILGQTGALGAPAVLAQTTLTRRQLLAHETTVTLSSPGSFSGLGYTGQRSGGVKVELLLTSVRAGTRTETR